jgi:hypothetical protein
MKKYLNPSIPKSQHLRPGGVDRSEIREKHPLAGTTQSSGEAFTPSGTAVYTLTEYSGKLQFVNTFLNA